MRRSIAILSALVMAATGFLGSAVVRADTGPEEWLPGIRDSGDIGGEPVLAGQIIASDGVPFPTGARVTLFVYPSADVVDALEVGESVTATPIAKARVAEEGRFLVRIEDLSELARYASKGGIVDFELRSVDDGEYAPYSFSRKLVVDAGPPLLTDPTSLPAPENTLAEQRSALAEHALVVSAVDAGYDESVADSVLGRG